MVIMAHIPFSTHDCQETQIKNPIDPIDPILGFGLVKYFYKWKFMSLKNDIFTKDFRRAHIIEVSWS